MEVWIAADPAQVHPTPYPTLATKSKVTSTGPTMAENGNRDPRMVADQEPPSSSADTSSYYDWLPRKGGEEWIQYDFPTPSTVSRAEVYWFVGPGNSPVKRPASWKLLYRDGDQWKPVTAQGPYGTAPDQFNQVTFQPVRTTALRLVLTPQSNDSAGIEEWQVY
jgi:hypothetical protein